jgi:hypothetical protein
MMKLLFIGITAGSRRDDNFLIIFSIIFVSFSSMFFVIFSSHKFCDAAVIPFYDTFIVSLD